MADHKSDGDEGALAVTRDGEHLLEKILDTGTGNKHTLVLELIGDVLDLVLDVGMRRWQVSHAGKDGSGLFPLVLLGEETGRLFVQGHAADKENSLKSERNNVDLRTAGEVHERSVVHPERETYLCQYLVHMQFVQGHFLQVPVAMN